MSTSGDIRVSTRGQMNLPSAVRHRWNLDDGGAVTYLDLGEVVVLVPGRLADLRRGILESLTDEDWAAARAGFGDDELATQ